MADRENGVTGDTTRMEPKATVYYTSDRVDVVRCRDCKHFETDSWAKIAEFPVPIIVAHEICKRWGEGCKTSPDGYCFMGERKETI